MSRVFSALVCAFALSLAACDETPGASDPFGTPPSIATVTLTPEELDDTSGNATVSLAPTIQVAVVGGDGDVTVRAFLRALDGETLLAEAEASGEAGVFELTPSAEIPRGAIGRYPITVTTEDASGRIGDRATAVLVFTSEALGGPRVTATSSSPRPISRPSSGSATVVLSADVDDPDGAANVAYAELRQQDGETLFRFRDDGEDNDAEAGDGRHTLALAINSGTPVGTYAFDVVAVDRTGLESPPTEITFTVQ